MPPKHKINPEIRPPIIPIVPKNKPSNKKIANDAIVGKAIIELEGEQIGFRNIFYSSSKVKVFTKEIIQNGKQVLLNLMGEHSDG